MKPYLSIIIPVYNESSRIENLTAIATFLKTQKYKSEMVVVNDGSIDKTLTSIKKIISKIPKVQKVSVVVLTYKTNKGKGYAIKKGMLKAKGRYRLFMDIDLSTPLNSFRKFENHLVKYPVIIGSRKMRGSHISIRQSRLRENLGKTFTKLSQLVLNVKVSDFTCGYKSFSDLAATEIFKRQKINRWGFDSEVLFLATKLGFVIKEVPVSWVNHPDSKVKFPQDLVSSLIELIKIRVNYFTNKYALK